MEKLQPVENASPKIKTDGQNTINMGQSSNVTILDPDFEVPKDLGVKVNGNGILDTKSPDPLDDNQGWTSSSKKKNKKKHN